MVKEVNLTQKQLGKHLMECNECRSKFASVVVHAQECKTKTQNWSTKA